MYNRVFHKSITIYADTPSQDLGEIAMKKKDLYRHSNTIIAAGIIAVILAGGAATAAIVHHNKQSDVTDVAVQEVTTAEPTESAEQASIRLAKESQLAALVDSLETSYKNFRLVFDVYTDTDTLKACVDDIVASIRAIDEFQQTESGTENNTQLTSVQSETADNTISYAAHAEKSDIAANTDSTGSNATNVALSNSQRNAMNQIAEKDADDLIYSDFKVLNTIASHILEKLDDDDSYQTLVASLDDIPDFDAYNTALDEKAAEERAAAQKAAEEAEAAAKAAAEAEAEQTRLAEETNNEDVAEEDEHANDEVADEEGAAPMVLTSNMSFGIDVSHYQSDAGAIDWKAVKESGVTFAIIKCGGRSIGSDGKLYKDAAFEQNIVGALANGIQVGIYFFSQATTTAEASAEADYCLSLIQKYKITYPVAFDWESGTGYRVNKAKISNTLLTNICITFADKIAAAGYTPMIYFCRNDWYGRVNATALTSRYKVWLAYYFKAYYYTSRQWQVGDDGPEFEYNYDMWQYGVTNTVAGINTYTDMDVAMFSYDNYTIDLYEAFISIDSDLIEVPYGKASQFLDSCHAMNCIGTSNSVVVMIDNKRYTTKAAINKVSVGTHDVTISFTDPLYGTISKSFKIKVTRTTSSSDD
jgi:GH25 family lysozyme M1 (1,4-beta-N-acetylmuramidase)